MNFQAPDIDYAGIAPVIALTVGLCVVLLSGVFKPLRRSAPALTMLTLGATAGLLIWHWGESLELVAGALRLDDLAISISLIAILTAACCVLLSVREPATEEAGSGEYHALLLGSVLGMTLLAQADNLVTFFVAIEILSIPLYILCAANLRREGSLESGLKYLIVGSLGSATLLYGMAFLYGGTGSTDFAGIAAGIGHQGLVGDPLILIGIAMAAVGLAFKTSIAPFHQWSPDVYQGRRRRSPGSWRWRPRPPPSPSSCASSTPLLGRRSTTGNRPSPRWRRFRSSSATSAPSARTR